MHIYTMASQGDGPDGELKELLETKDYPLDAMFEIFTRNSELDASKTRDRSKFSKWCGKLLIFLTLISLLFVGSILNCVQLLLCITVRLSNSFQWRRWHKLANGHLTYLIFTQPTFLIYFWTRVELKVHINNKQMIEDIKENILGILLANHTYELDWLICFMLADQVGNIGSYKCFAKNELKWLPVIGWTFWMSDVIYVKRDWRHDKWNIEKTLDELLTYDQILLGIFAEGTRMTKEKYCESLEFARAKNLSPYKYHLFPRARGFNFTLRHYLRHSDSANKVGDKEIRLVNMEIVLPDRPNFRHFLEGSYIKADVYCEEVKIAPEIRQEAIESVDTENCPKMTQLLLDIYRRKDEIIDDYTNEKGFHTPSKRAPNGALLPLKKPIKVAIYWLLFMSMTYGTFTYLALSVFARSITFWTLLVTFLTSGMLMLRRIEKESTPNNERLLMNNKSKQQIDCDSMAA